MEQSEIIEPKTSNVSLVSTTLGMTEDSLRKDVFNALVGPNTKALIVEGTATGTVHRNLLPLIKEVTGKGVSVFVVSNNPADSHGVKEIKYENHTEAAAAGAILLRDVNIKQEAEVLSAIQEEIDKGKTGQELNDVIVKRFGTPNAQIVK